MKNYTFIIPALCGLLLAGCDKEVDIQTKDYPYVLLKEVNVVNGEGITATAEILRIGNDSIKEYGFVWNSSGKPVIGDYRFSITGEPEPGIFSGDIKNCIDSGVVYEIRPYVISHKYTVYGNVLKFTGGGNLPPVLNDFNPKSGKVGSLVVIEGDNFNSNPEKNIVRFGKVRARAIQATTTQLTVEVPYMLEDAIISVETTFRKYMIGKIFKIINPWQKITAPFSDGVFSQAPYFFSVGGKGYFFNDELCWEYDQESSKWTKKSAFPGAKRWNALAFSINNKGYFGLGNDMGQGYHDFWEYDPATNNWLRLSDYPGNGVNYAKGFSINNDGFVGFGNNIPEFWKYKQDTKEWTELSCVTGSGLTFYFGIAAGNKAYIGCGLDQIDIYEYDPPSETWTIKGIYPGNGKNNLCGFSINNKVYIGLGWSQETWYQDFWEYTPEDNSWIQLTDCPITTAYGYSTDHFGYIIICCPVIYQFDPSKN